MTFASFQEWIEQVAASIRNDPLWSFETYRKALFLSDLAWLDCDTIFRESKARNIARQMLDSAGSVAANIEEGYGRGFGDDYARFLRIALGSARETRGWYFRSRAVFEAEVVAHRMSLLDDIIAGLTITAQQQRSRKRAS
jgi:four helix bundle protein